MELSSDWRLVRLPRTVCRMSRGTPGVLLLQLGTPDAPTPKALRRYLREFLGDRRVIDLSRPVWWVILNFFVLPRRPARSAALYRRVWTDAGSPLLVTTRAQAGKLRARLERLYGTVPVAVGMRYGTPSIASAVGALLDAGADRIVVLPMFPQYAGATTGSAVEALLSAIGRRRVIPPIRVVPPYGDDRAYIDALAAVARDALARADRPPDHLLVSFHGLPARYVADGDPYQRECEATFAALAASLGWPVERMTLAYQSRFGSEPWLQPYADETIRALPARGVRSLAVICPGFTADCLETIEEMGMTNRELFLEAGGESYQLIPCVNDDDRWIAGMASLVAREAAGWLTDNALTCQTAYPGRME